MAALLMAAMSLTLPLAAEAQQCVVHTGLGSIQGFQGDGGLCGFRGIPYAKPPIADLRWRPPVAANGWKGTLDGRKFGSTCIQNFQDGWNTIQGRLNTSEDCLYLNVVAPLPTAGRLHPVVVYFHAGEFDYGAAADRESDWPFFAPDVVLVTPNSRLGVLGYLGGEALRSRSAAGDTGHYGIQDQRLALRWVRDHVSSFGGDPSNVAIMGESSGGTSVSVHLTSKASWGLFHKAILESPGLTQVHGRA